MRFDKNCLFDYLKYDENEKEIFKNFEIIDCTLNVENDAVYIVFKNDVILPYKNYMDLRSFLEYKEIENFHLSFKVQNDDLGLKDINHYIEYFQKLNNNDAFSNAVVILNNYGFVLSYIDENTCSSDEGYLYDLKLFFHDLGYRKNIEQEIRDEKENEIETVYVPQESVKTEANNVFNRKKIINKVYKEVKIEELVDNLNKVIITGNIFKFEERGKKERLTTLLYVKDDTGALIVKLQNRFFEEDIIAKVKKEATENFAHFWGDYQYDDFNKEYYFNLRKIEFIDNPNPIKDEAEEKRVELHAHTKYSEMDGVCSPTYLIETAFKMGHKAVAITDHLNIEAYHESFMTAKKLSKERDFKILYGAELNMVYPNLNIVYNCKDGLLKEAEYIVFDLETTGLSIEYDSIIEFGAVLMYKGNIVERKDFFIKPPFSLSQNIKKLTNISESDLANARTFKEAKDEILAFIKDRVLVAHNASFDYGFLNQELKRIGEKPLNNIVIDTLDLSRSLFKGRRAYRLGNMAKLYNVKYDEDVAHRADYDADVLASVFNMMLKDIAKENVETFKELSEFQSEDAFIKNRAFHTTVLCKDKVGLKNLFKLISISHIDSLAVFGKANTKGENSEYMAEPRIFKEVLNEHREGLLIGSACLNGEVFETAQTKSKEELAKVISFYDYIEVQPLENYRFLYEDRQLFTIDRLKEYIKDIIDIALSQNKIVVATGDSHYIKKEEKIIRDVFVNAPAIGGLAHPLYVYNEEKRIKQIIPDQHFRTTNEMLEAFSWLDNEELIKDIVINNTNKIADMVDYLSPFSSELKPPKVVDAIKIAKGCGIIEEPFVFSDDVITADEYLEKLVWHNAKEMFGENMESFIKERIERELDAIISHGYGVIYYTCHLLVKRSNNDGYIVGSRGSVGSSFVATLSGITEVNPLVPYYLCPKCHHFELISDVASGYDARDKKCPECGTIMHGEGQNIPFETFMGFNGDKVPDIDLNFSGDYQPRAHLFTREIFGKDNVFRAGTISTVKEKTAFGYVNRYCEIKKIDNMTKAYKNYLAANCIGVKRTTGQHAGGIVVLPDDMEIEDVTPIQYPANDKESPWYSTHFEYHDYNDNLLKFDILGHVDPTTMALLEKVSGIDIKKIPLNDERAISLFYSPEALNIINPIYKEATGACGLPEFGTANTRNTLIETRPKKFSELVQISGLSHGTNVWADNAQTLIRSGIKLADVIGCRDDIMGNLISYGIDNLEAFNIMEAIRKGKVAHGQCSNWDEYEKDLLDHNVPKWYVESCKKIEYLFPKAHAVAYCIMAVRIAWFKVYYPLYYYISFLTLRCDAYEIKTMTADADIIYARLEELRALKNSRDPNHKATVKDLAIFDTLELCFEMVCRGYRIGNIDLYRSDAKEFIVNPDNDHELIPPFVVIDGLGENVAISIINARKEGRFLSKEDLMKRTSLSKTLVSKLDELHVLDGMDDSNQISLF